MIRPQAAEVKAITALLEGEEFETSADLAKEIIRTTYRLFQEREWQIWVHREDGMLLLWGPFTGDNEAAKAAASAGLGGENRIYKLGSVAAMKERVAELASGQCVCGHTKGLHQHEKASGKCVEGYMQGQKWIYTCECKTYEEKL